MKTFACECDRDEILRRLGSLRSDSVRRWGRMSAHQMVCHLSDGYRVLFGQRHTNLAVTPLPRPLMKLIALYVPVRWPPGIATTPDLDQNIGGTAPSTFAADLAELQRLIDGITVDRCGEFRGRLHPIFGPMSESAWLRWAYLHADHHLRQFGV
jgi:hypothetical protein